VVSLGKGGRRSLNLRLSITAGLRLRRQGSVKVQLPKRPVKHLLFVYLLSAICYWCNAFLSFNSQWKIVNNQ